MLAFGVHSGTPVTQELSAGTLGGGGVRSIDRGAYVVGIGSSRGCRSHRTSSIAPLPAVSELVGASEETGGVFDPLGLAADEVGTAVESYTVPFLNLASCVALFCVVLLVLELHEHCCCVHAHTDRYTRTHQAASCTGT